MSYLDFVRTKHKTLVIWFMFHLTALFVNVFAIDYCWEDQKTKRPDWAILNVQQLTVRKNCLLCDAELKENRTSSFWPLVPFYQSKVYFTEREKELNDYNVKLGNGLISSKRFHGIFFRYDFSEFIAYSLLIFIVLYFKWLNKNK